MHKAEFDKYAEEYYKQHASNIAVSGYTPEFFAEYKIADAQEVVGLQGLSCERILDFGSGIGNSMPWFRKYFPSAELTCASQGLALTFLSSASPALKNMSRFRGIPCHWQMTPST